MVEPVVVVALAVVAGATVVDVDVDDVDDVVDVVPAARVRSRLLLPPQAAKATSATAVNLRRTHLVSLEIWTCA
jgi:hypothetical protein